MKNLSSLYSDYPLAAQRRLEELRRLIHEVASRTNGVGELEECLKWGELSFVTSETKSGSTVRIDWKSKDPERFHIYVNCQTKLISIFKELYPDDFIFEGNRCISFNLSQKLPRRKISKCIEIALTYNLHNHKDFFN